MAASSSATKPSVGIISIGDMGMGMAKLLRAHDYQVYTVTSGRSSNTKDRVKAAQINDLPTDKDLVVECDVILSIVPPGDAVATAKRIIETCQVATEERLNRKGVVKLVYVDANAISSRTVKSVSESFSAKEAAPRKSSFTRKLTRTLSLKPDNEVKPSIPIDVRFLDGGIIGGPPSQQADQTWHKPSFVMSGPAKDFFPQDLQDVLNVKVVSDQIGSASTLKSCFASLTKGLYAIGLASYTTAHAAGLLPELRSQLEQRSPGIHQYLENGLVNVPPKAYRWVDEMKQIGETFADEGQLGPGHGGQAMFNGVSEIYKLMADDTVLGQEVSGKRKRGTTVEDIAEAIHNGIEAKKSKGTKDEKLDLAWRGSWS